MKRKATKAARKLPADFADIKLTFLERIMNEVQSNSIPLALVLNWDQTGSKLVPVSEWTLEKEGTKQIPVVGKDDKREITVLITVAATGDMLPPQVIYKGETPGCHAKVTFPEDWAITHGESHWSTEVTMLEYVDNVLVPYVSTTRQKLGLADDHPALAIFDVFMSHRCDSVLKKLKENNIHQVFIPAGCTGELQPLDISFNEEFKSLMKFNFSRWYANEVKESLDSGTNLQDIKVDPRATLMKHLHTNWLMMSLTTLKATPDVIIRGFEKSGIIDTIS